MANIFAFSINSEHIVILGGLKKRNENFIPKNEEKKIYELESRVFVFKSINFKWKELKAFPFKKKLSHVSYNNHGKFFCYILENNRRLPKLLAYDIRNCFP